MRIAGQKIPKGAWIALIITGSLMVLWLFVLYLGSPRHFDWPFRVEVNSWGLFFTSFGVLVNVFTLIFLGLTFFNQQKHHDEMMVESACFSLLNAYSSIAVHSYVGQEIEVLKRDLKYLSPVEYTGFDDIQEGHPKWNETTKLSLRSGRSFFGDFYRFMRGGAFVWRNKLQIPTHNEVFKRIYEEQFNRNEFWPICNTLFSNFLAILVYFDLKKPKEIELYLNLLDSSITMEERAIFYYLGHAKFNNGLSATQQKVLIEYFDRFPITSKVPKDILLCDDDLDWGSYRPS